MDQGTLNLLHLKSNILNDLQLQIQNLTIAAFDKQLIIIWQSNEFYYKHI